MKAVTEKREKDRSKAADMNITTVGSMKGSLRDSSEFGSTMLKNEINKSVEPTPLDSEDDDSQTSSNIESDDSYYDEIDNIELAPITDKEAEDKKIHKKFKLTKFTIKTEAEKMEKIFEVGQMINKKRLTEADTLTAFEFLKNLPSIGKSFDSIKKTQFKMCLEKIKFKLFEQG